MCALFFVCVLDDTSVNLSVCMDIHNDHYNRDIENTFYLFKKMNTVFFPTTTTVTTIITIDENNINQYRG